MMLLLEHQRLSKGMMGYKTPNIDRIANEGMIFTDATASKVHGRARGLHYGPKRSSVNPRIVSPEKSYDPAQCQFRIPRKVVKGGSFLCAPNYYLRYRPAARQPQMIDTGMNHIGFRCIVRSEQTSA